MDLQRFKEVNKPNRSFVIFDDYSQVNKNTMGYILSKLGEQSIENELLEEYYNYIVDYYDDSELNSIISKVKCLSDRLLKHKIKSHYQIVLTPIDKSLDNYMTVILFLAYKENDIINFKDLLEDFKELSGAYDWNKE